MRLMLRKPRLRSNLSPWLQVIPLPLLRLVPMVMLTDWAMAAVGSATGVINRLRTSPSDTNKFFPKLSSTTIGGQSNDGAALALSSMGLGQHGQSRWHST